MVYGDDLNTVWIFLRSTDPSACCAYSVDLTTAMAMITRAAASSPHTDLCVVDSVNSVDDNGHLTSKLSVLKALACPEHAALVPSLFGELRASCKKSVQTSCHLLERWCDSLSSKSVLRKLVPLVMKWASLTLKSVLLHCVFRFAFRLLEHIKILDH